MTREVKGLVGQVTSVVERDSQLAAFNGVTLRLVLAGPPSDSLFLVRRGWRNIWASEAGEG